MRRSIIEYQRVSQTVTQMLKDNGGGLSAFGNIVTGELWENCDIDFFAICKDEGKVSENIYSNDENLPVYFKTMNKAEFLTLKGPEVKGSYLQRVMDGLEEKTRKVNKHLKMTIDRKIVDASEVLHAYFREKTGQKSAREIIEDEFFNNFNIRMEGILHLLIMKNILKRDFRTVESINKEQLILENVYSF